MHAFTEQEFPMKTIPFLASALLAASFAHADTLAVRQPEKPARKMQLSSPDIRAGRLADAQVADGFGCNGGNTSPALKWSGVPANAKSLVLTAYDPDAPTGSGFWHWAVYNLPADASGLPAGGGLPAGAVALNNDAGQAGYIGACPPKGEKAHRYIFTLYALDSRLDLPPAASPAVLGFTLNGKILATARLTARYAR